MASEPIRVAQRTAVQSAVIIGVAVQDQVARARGEIPSVPHAVMEGQLLETIVAAARHPEAFRLRMIGLYRYLHSHHFEALENAIVCRRVHQKSGDSITGGTDIREVEHGPFP